MTATRSFNVLFILFVALLVLLAIGVPLAQAQEATPEIAATLNPPPDVPGRDPSPFVDFLTTPIRLYIQYLINMALSALMGVLFWQARKLILAGVLYFKSRLTTDQVKRLEALVRQLVLAAEQLGAKDEIFKAGRSKKEWVLQRANQEVDRLGLRDIISPHMIADMIEAAVKENFNNWNALASSAPLASDYIEVPEDQQEAFFAELDELYAKYNVQVVPVS